MFLFEMDGHLWRRKWQPTPVFLPGESQGRRSLMGCCPQGYIESDTTEVTQHAYMQWRRKWQPTPVFLPGESQGRRSLVGCRLRGLTELDTTEVTQQQHHGHLQSLILLPNVDSLFFLSYQEQIRSFKRKCINKILLCQKMSFCPILYKCKRHNGL